MDSVKAFFFIEMQDNLCIRSTFKNMPFAFQISSYFLKIINLSIIGNPNSAVLVAHGLMTGGR